MNNFKTLILTIASKLSWLPPLMARIAVGVIFIQTGWGKLHNLQQVAAFFQKLGIPAAHLQAPFVATVEFAGGILILLGLFTRLAAIPLIGTMIIAIITAKLPEFKTAGDFLGSVEFLYIILFAWLFTAGPGTISIDRFICKDCAGVCPPFSEDRP